jgi:hypothetical protein
VEQVIDNAGRRTWNGMSVAWQLVPVLGRFLPYLSPPQLVAFLFFLHLRFVTGNRQPAALIIT